MHLKKLKYNIIGSPGVREFRFTEGLAGERIRAAPESKGMTIYVPPGLPAHTKPTNRPVSVQKSNWASRQSAARKFQDHHPPAPSSPVFNKPHQSFENGSHQQQLNNGPAAALANALTQVKS